MNKVTKAKKVLKYTYMYGLSRTAIKVKGQLHMKKTYDDFPTHNLSKNGKTVGILGCGNHAFTDIAYFLRKHKSNIIAATMDIDMNKARSLAKEYKAYQYGIDINDILHDENIELVYIVSNHATHTPYAVKVLESKKDVFIEKPIAINMNQYVDLVRTVRTSDNHVYTGYNRPFSQAIELIKPYISNESLTLNCFIMGHKLDADHWYRKPSEGSRVVGNLGHWIDLSTHLVMSREILPTKFDLTLLSANVKHKDDDFVLTIKTNLDDLIVLTFSTRCDPFEGVMENISFQNEKIIANIEDFRKMTIWEENKKIVKRFIPKDAGHENSVLQPFSQKKRDWKELEWSTFMMLKVEEMLQNDVKEVAFDIEDEINKLLK